MTAAAEPPVAVAPAGSDELFPGRPLASGRGPWPGTDPLEAVRTVFGELGRDGGLPFLPQLASRGPGADAVGRTAGLLLDLPVDLQPVGWRLVDHPGRDASRADGYRSADLDALAEGADGWTGPLAIGAVGPWSLAAALWLPRGERAVVDEGASRDLVASLAEGLAQHVVHVRRLLPGADVVLVLDEPDLPSVLGGRVPRASGWGRLPPVELPVARDALAAVLTAAAGAGARTAVRCPAPLPGEGPGPTPVALLRSLVEAGAQGIGVDWVAATAVGAPAWEAVAETAESGVALWLGVAPGPASEVVTALSTPWRRLGLDVGLLSRAVLEPTAGVAALPPSAARAVLGQLREGADALAQAAAGG